jgi:hypothetical protein
MAPLRTGFALAITVGVFYALCTLAWTLAPGPFLNFMNSLFHGMDFSSLVQPGPATQDRRTAMNQNTPAYGLWTLVVLNSAIFLMNRQCNRAGRPAHPVRVHARLHSRQAAGALNPAFQGTR